jgi:hypothetical protein
MSLTIDQAENTTLNVPIVDNNSPVDVSTATDIVLTLQKKQSGNLPPFVGYSYSLNAAPGFGSLTVNVNNTSVDIVIETTHSVNFEVGMYEACIIVKTPDVSFLTGSKRTQYTSLNVLRVQPGCNKTDLMP